MANPFTNGSPLYRDIWNKVHTKRENCLILTVGKVQKGKSTVNNIIGYNVDPLFTADTSYFQPQRWAYDLAKKKFKRGRFIMFEEIGTESGGMNRRKWYDFNNFVVNDILQTFGYEGIIVAFSVPSMNYIDKNALLLMDYKIEVLDKDLKNRTNTAKVFRLEYNESYGKLYRHFLRDNTGGKVDPYYFKMPNDERFKNIIKMFKSKENIFKKDIQKQGALKLKQRFSTECDIEEVVEELVNNFTIGDKTLWVYHRNLQRWYPKKGLIKSKYNIGLSNYSKAKDLAEMKLRNMGIRIDQDEGRENSTPSPSSSPEDVPDPVDPSLNARLTSGSNPK